MNESSTSCWLAMLTARYAVENCRPDRPPARQLGERVAQHTLTELAHEAGVLGERQELARQQQATIGMQPAGQHLEADHLPTGQVDDRLEVRHDLAALESVPQFGRGAQRRRTTTEREPAANAAMRSRPPALAPYIAESASRSRSSARWPATVFTVKPMLAVMISSCPSIVIGCCTDRRSRSADERRVDAVVEDDDELVATEPSEPAAFAESSSTAGAATCLSTRSPVG